MKRKTDLQPTKPAKQPRINKTNSARRGPPSAFKDTESARVQAEPYRLATVRFPIDALTPTWSIGTNRPIDHKHVQTLCRIFMQNGGVERQSWDNRLLVLCTRQEVERMTSHLEENQSNQDTVNRAGRGGLGYPSFANWILVNGGKAELMAGQHRVDALREYVRRTGSSEEELWWICDVYDKDALPHDLNIKLRVNRRDPTLQDSHGQIWRQLAAMSATDDSRFQGTNSEIERNMLQALGLSGPVKFPIRRLVTLWKNDRWRSMITRWCETTLGQTTFTVSTWEWMASCRMDEYWFATFEHVLGVISQLSQNMPENVTAGDWIQLANLPRNRTAEDVRELFYPCQEGSIVVDGLGSRRDGFLIMLDNEAYRRAYDLIATINMSFPNVHALLKITKDEGRIMMRVLCHVVLWLNSNPTQVSGRENNKPSLRKDLLPALQDYWGEEAEERSILLERKVLDFVRGHIAQFKSPMAEAYLNRLPDDNDASYAERFVHEPWRGMLELVRGTIGASFPSKVILSLDPHNASTSVAKSTIAKSMCALMDRIPEVAHNPALNNEAALDALCSRLGPLVTEWAAEYCHESERDRHRDRAKPSQPTVENIDSEDLDQENLDGSISPVNRGRNAHSVGGDATQCDQACDQEYQERVKEQVDRGSQRGTTSPAGSEHGETRNFHEFTAEDLTGMRKIHRQNKVASHGAPVHSLVLPQNRKRLEKPASQSITPSAHRATAYRAGSSWRRGPAAQSSSKS